MKKIFSKKSKTKGPDKAYPICMDSIQGTEGPKADWDEEAEDKFDRCVDKVKDDVKKDKKKKKEAQTGMGLSGEFPPALQQQWQEDRKREQEYWKGRKEDIKKNPKIKFDYMREDEELKKEERGPVTGSNILLHHPQSQLEIKGKLIHRIGEGPFVEVGIIRTEDKEYPYYAFSSDAEATYNEGNLYQDSFQSLFYVWATDVSQGRTAKEAFEGLRGSQDNSGLATPEKSMLQAAKKKKKDPCWKGYEQVGMKNKDGKEVPNCVPKKSKKKSNILFDVFKTAN